MKNQENPTLKNIFEILEKNSFDIKRVINNFSLDQFAPIFEGLFSQNKKPDERYNFASSESFGVKPIKEFCDAEILRALNSYMGV